MPRSKRQPPAFEVAAEKQRWERAVKHIFARIQAGDPERDIERLVEIYALKWLSLPTVELWERVRNLPDLAERWRFEDLFRLRFIPHVRRMDAATQEKFFKLGFDSGYRARGPRVQERTLDIGRRACEMKKDHPNTSLKDAAEGLGVTKDLVRNAVKVYCREVGLPDPFASKNRGAPG
jgi:hypothetical protein